MKSSNDTIGNRSCDLLVCSVVPQLLRASNIYIYIYVYICIYIYIYVYIYSRIGKIGRSIKLLCRFHLQLLYIRFKFRKFWHN
jgi:hypothetical protein